MIKNPFAGFDFSNPFGTDAMKRSRNLFGVHTTPRSWKHGARDIPFGMGAASLYVDSTSGDDSNDGESWKTAKETIQEAIDVADPWTQIYIKAGTYAENVSIPTGTDNIALTGQRRAGVIIKPASGIAVDIDSDDCQLSRFTAIGNSANATDGGINHSGSTLLLHKVNIGNQNAAGTGAYLNGNRATVHDAHINQSYRPDKGIMIENDWNLITNCILENVAAYTLYIYNAKWNEIRNNTLSASTSVYIDGTTTRTAIYHNNLMGSTAGAYDFSSGANLFVENYYLAHTNIDNGFGIATEPYSIITNSIDHRPVAAENGWNAFSNSRSLLRKKTGAQATQAATNANGTSWVNLKTITPTTSDIELYQIKMTVAGSWAGNAKYRVIIGSTKVYPFPADKNITSGTLESFIFPINVQIKETCKIQFRSDNAGDGAGDTVALNQLDYATVL